MQPGKNAGFDNEKYLAEQAEEILSRAGRFGSKLYLEFGGKRLSLNLDETLIALSISATNNPAAQLAMEQLPNLRGCDAHMTHIPTPGDEAGLKKLGVNATSDPNFPSKALFIE